MNMRRHLSGRALLGALLGLGLGLWACSEDPATCSDQADCFIDQYCVEGTCRDEMPIIIEDDNNGQGSNDTAGSNNPDPNNSEDNKDPGDNGSPNNTSSNGDPGNNGQPAGVCRVNPFDAPSCEQGLEDMEEEPNDNDFKNTQLNPTGGCAGVGPESYRPIVDRVVGRRVCHWEAGDWYNQYFYACPERSFVATIELRVIDACEPEEVYFVIQRGGSEVVFDSQDWQTYCAPDDIECAPLEHGGWRVQLLFADSNTEGARPGGGYRFGVYGPEHVQYSYELDITVPELE